MQYHYLARCVCLLILMVPVPGGARSFLYNPTYLQFSKDAWQGSEPWAVSAVTPLLAAANRALLEGPYSVILSFHLIYVPGTTPHDFISTGAYWWPNPNTPNGLPYIRRDGHVNPDSAGSSTQLRPMAHAVNQLGLAYFFTEDETYAQQAAYLAREFFLTPATRMNPHTEFGKIIPGVAEEGGFVVADIGNNFRVLYEGLGPIEASPHWTGNDKRAMQQWSAEFLH